jgi:hypothetical protein
VSGSVDASVSERRESSVLSNKEITTTMKQNTTKPEIKENVDAPAAGRRVSRSDGATGRVRAGSASAAMMTGMPMRMMMMMMTMTMRMMMMMTILPTATLIMRRTPCLCRSRQES